MRGLERIDSIKINGLIGGKPPVGLIVKSEMKVIYWGAVKGYFIKMVNNFRLFFRQIFMESRIGAFKNLFA